MLIDLHANPGNLSPEAFAKAVQDAGLAGVVVARTHQAGDLTPWFEALEDLELAAFAGVELRLERGVVVFIPADWQGPFAELDWTPPEGDFWTPDDINDREDEVPGAIVAGHPFCNELAAGALGDETHDLEGMVAVQTRAGRGRPQGDSKADGFAGRYGLARLGTSAGELEWLGRAATVVPDEVDDEADLIKILKAGQAWPVEFDEPGNRKDRGSPRGGRGRDDRGGRGRGRDDRRGRGGRGRDERGGRRDDRRGGGRSDRRGSR